MNEEWISDKTRFAYDGLMRQRITYPMVKDRQGLLRRVDWEEALFTVAHKLRTCDPGHMVAIGGQLSDVGECMLAMFGRRSPICCRVARRAQRPVPSLRLGESVHRTAVSDEWRRQCHTVSDS